MIGLDLNNNNDIYIDVSGNLALVQNINAVKISISCATKTTYGEIPLNTKLGIPYFATIFTAHPDVDLWESYMKDTINNLPDIVSVEYFTTNISKGILTYTTLILSKYGEVSING